MTNKAAIYIRVSTHWQVDKDSLQVQRRELINYADLVLGITEYEVFEDPGYSAKNTERPAFQAMMARLRTGEFSHLLVWKIDRISRNIIDFSEMYQEIKSLGVAFVSKNEQFDTSNAIGEAMLKIILVFAELERNMTAERVQNVMLSRAGNGQWNGGRIPFGYHHDPDTDTFTIDENEAKSYVYLMDSYLETQSLIKTATIMNEHGYTHGRKPWSPETVRSVLINRFYIGEYVYNKSSGNAKKQSSDWVIVKNHHPPLIEESKFDAAQLLLKRNRRSRSIHGNTYNRQYVHIFAGLIVCARCGANCDAAKTRARKNGYRPSIYTCSTRRRNKEACNNPAIGDYTVGPFVMQLAANILNLSKRIRNNWSFAKFIELLTYKLDCEFDPDEAADYMAYMKESASNPERNIFTYKEKVATPDEEFVLQSMIDKNEMALSRLKQLYLYSDSQMSESEYVIARNKLVEDQKKYEERLSTLKQRQSEEQLAEDTAKASYLIMLKMLEDPKRTDFTRLAAAGDPAVLKRFFNTSGQLYRSMELSKKLPEMSEDEQFRLLASDGMLVKRPILVRDQTVLVGFREAEWEQVK